ncbi:MAG: quinohemoprotein alcohol dehydrogenase [Sphingomonas bacterium]|nr:quinohemoprotein alcohol dehydrogenase [Sphingomonas bacterium]
MSTGRNGVAVTPGPLARAPRPRSLRVAGVALAGLLALLAGCQASRPNAAAVPAVGLAGGAGDQWVTPGGDIGKSHFSRLADINAGNVDRLGFAWEYRTNTTRVMEGTPVVVDGVMYASGPLGRVWALDAATGRELWAFEPPVDMQVNRFACCDQANRGVAVSGGKLFVAALDGMLYALDVKTGAVVWKADSVVDHSRGYSSTGAPEVANGVVVIGNAGAEYDTRGYVTGYDLATGKQRWRFWIVPRDPAKGAQEAPYLDAALKTWSKDTRWDVGGGGTAWDAINYDPVTDTVFVGTGNGGPYNQADRSPGGGDNLYLSSIVALDPRTGLPKWHYQETPGDNWDFTATAPMVLTDLVVDGVKRPVILHAPKNGFLYVLDRRDGKLLRANKFGRVNWASHVDMVTGRPVVDQAAADYSTTPKIVFPASPGAHNWQPMAWNPDTGLLYLSVLDMGNLLFRNTDGKAPRAARRLNNAAALIFSPDLPVVVPTLPAAERDAIMASAAWKDQKGLEGHSYLRAIDPLTGKTAWQVELSGWWDRGAPLATAGGLVFQGTDTGHFNVYDAKSGTLLKSIFTGTSTIAAPMTYRIGGVQYVAIAAAWGGGGWGFPHKSSAQYQRGNDGRIIVFRLDGGKTPVPDKLPPFPPIPPAPPQLSGVTPGMLAEGQGLFMANCAICHANATGSNAPDLRRMQSHDAFEQIVLGGLLVPNGMPRWDDAFDKAQAKSIHAYLIALQATAHADYRKAIREGRDPDAEGAPTILSNF